MRCLWVPLVLLIVTLLVWSRILTDATSPWLAILLAIPIIWTALNSLYLGNDRFKTWVTEKRYHLFGPSAEMKVLGTFPLDDESEFQDVLDEVRHVAKSWRISNQSQAQARVDSRRAESIILSAGARTLTATIRSDEDEDLESRPSLYLVVELRGYQNKVRRLRYILENEIERLLVALSDACSDKRGWDNLSLSITIEGRNPFLGFYVRDIPARDISHFVVRAKPIKSNADARIEIVRDGFSVQASTPRSLVRVARRYLASPAIADIE